jgi:hypothetical protein
MRKEVWFGLSIMAAVVLLVFTLMPAPSQMRSALSSADPTGSPGSHEQGVVPVRRGGYGLREESRPAEVNRRKPNKPAPARNPNRTGGRRRETLRWEGPLATEGSLP